VAGAPIRYGESDEEGGDALSINKRERVIQSESQQSAHIINLMNILSYISFSATRPYKPCVLPPREDLIACLDSCSKLGREECTLTPSTR
jgi:hypothetical protein